MRWAIVAVSVNRDVAASDVAMTVAGSTAPQQPAPAPPSGLVPAGLRERDPDYIRRSLPFTWPLLAAWFRPEVRMLGRIPANGPVLLVGNHSGGNVAPDTLVFTLAFYRRFGVERPFFQLAGLEIHCDDHGRSHAARSFAGYRFGQEAIHQNAPAIFDRQK